MIFTRIRVGECQTLANGVKTGVLHDEEEDYSLISEGPEEATWELEDAIRLAHPFLFNSAEH